MTKKECANCHRLKEDCRCVTKQSDKYREMANQLSYGHCDCQPGHDEEKSDCCELRQTIEQSLLSVEEQTEKRVREETIKECADIADDLMGKYGAISDRASQFEFEAAQIVRNKILSLLKKEKGNG